MFDLFFPVNFYRCDYFPPFFALFQAEMESRIELEQRLKEAEEALQHLEKGLNSLERSTETEEQMKGNVTQLRSE